MYVLVIRQNIKYAPMGSNTLS